MVFSATSLKRLRWSIAAFLSVGNPLSRWNSFSIQICWLEALPGFFSTFYDRGDQTLKPTQVLRVSVTWRDCEHKDLGVDKESVEDC